MSLTGGRCQSGAGLIEVMVSLLILGIGLLGVLSLQAQGIGSNQRAVFVTEAHVLAQDMAERILAYGSQGSNGNTGPIAGEYNGIDTGSTSSTAPTCDASGCSLAQTRLLDAYEWMQAVNNSSLPNASGQVNWDGGNNVYTIRLMWDQNRTGANRVNCANNNKKRFLTCFEMEVGL